MKLILLINYINLSNFDLLPRKMRFVYGNCKTAKYYLRYLEICI